MFKIEKNVPVPPKRGGGREPCYPFADMDIGDSFSVPLVGAPTSPSACNDSATQRLSCAASAHFKRNNRKFTVRELRDEGVARCWRVA